MTIRIISIMQHPDFLSRPAGEDGLCEKRRKNSRIGGISALRCKRKAKQFLVIPALGGYPEFSVALCNPHGEEAVRDYHAYHVARKPLT